MVNANLLSELQWRGFIKDSTSIDTITKELKSQTTVYTGFDLTATSLHVGNLVTIMNLRHFFHAGHNIIILLGGATTKIGDPSDKNEMRKIIPQEQIEDNKKAIQSCIGQFIDVTNERVKFVDNSEWFDGMGYINFLSEIGRHFTINRMVAIDFVKRRLDSETPLSFLEFNYMLMQGYDFLHLFKTQNCKIQVGGSDQWGNIIQGVELIRRITGNDAMAFTIPLLLTSDGRKMGKTENGAVWLSPAMLSSFDYYQYFRNVDDINVPTMLKIFTDLSQQTIAELSNLHGKDINNAKEILAFEATKICRGEVEALKARQVAISCFSENTTRNIDGLPTFICQVSTAITSALVLSGFVKSNTEAKQLIRQGGVFVDDVKINDIHYTIPIGNHVIKSGKRMSRLDIVS